MISALSRPLEHRVTLVRPGPGSLAWLDEAVRRAQVGDPLAPVTAIVPSPYIGAVLRQALAGRGCANLRFSVQLRPIAERIARIHRIPGFDHPLTGPLEAAAIRVAVRDAGGEVLRPLADHRALQDSLGALFRDLRHLDESEPTLAALAVGGSVASAATWSFARYQRLTAGYPDMPQQLRLAAEAIADHSEPASWAADVGSVLVYLPARLDGAEQRLLAALSRHVPIDAAFAWFDDPQADDLTREAAQTLASGLHTAIARSHRVTAASAVRLLTAPDPEEEARAVVRRLLADMDDGVPLWRMAIHYTAEDPYGPLVRETLDAAQVPWHSALGRPAAAGWAARSLLGLLALRERRFAREAVLDWLVARPPTTPGADGDPLPDVPISAWDRLSRRAQVQEGADQWITRFERLIRTLEYEERERDDWRAQARAHEMDEDAPRPLRDSDHARSIVAAIQRLDRDTLAPAAPAAWQALVEWAAQLRRAYVPEAANWPDTERLASAALDAALESLEAASALEPTATLGVFRESLAAALEARRLDEGQAGVGVLVAPLGASTGAAFERVYVVGMAEGLLPARLPTDPLASAGSDSSDPLRRRQRQRQADRRGLLASLASADSGVVVLSYARSDGAARASYPSRWLLEQAARLEHVPTLYASDLAGLVGQDRPWLEAIASPYDELQRQRAPLNMADLRMRDVVAWHAAGRQLAHSPLAERSDLTLGRALRAARARASHLFTEFDGNLASLAPESRLIGRPFAADGGASSATSIERWAGCPFLYFMTNVLRVEATERPEDEWTLTALDKGSLVHTALEEFFRERLEQGRSTADEPFIPDDYTRLQTIASLLLDDLEAQGRTGHPIAWENARTAILRDLDVQLEREEAWRRADGLAPALFERTFGDLRDPDTWPAVEVPIGDGVVVRFRGAIDRIDLSPPRDGRRRAMVIDYKTGGAWGYDGLEQDPLLAGRHVQLALYARALRAGLPGADLDDVRAEYRFVSSKGKFQRLQIVSNPDTDARLQEVVRHAANGIQAGAFLAKPGQRERGSYQNCRFCEYDRICSTTRDEAWERKRSDASFVPLETLQ